MAENGKRQKPGFVNRTNIACAAITLAVLAVVFALIMHFRALSPVYTLEVKELDAESPAVAQAECRANHTRFSELLKEHTGTSWVWCGGDKLYLVKTSVLRINSGDDTPNFTAVTFDGGKGEHLKGYVIDPATPPRELGRIKLTDGEKYNFESVSMTIRVALKNGDINYKNAVYLWEKDSTEVIVASADSYQTVQDNIVSFTDDGNTTHTCYILDTKID